MGIAKTARIYISLARPHLEYAAALWDPHTSKDVQMLENTQKFALKLITHNWDSSYQDLVALAELPTLSSRRLHMKLTEAERGTPEPRRTHLRSFAELISEASPNSTPKLRRTHLRSFAEVNSEASPKSPPKLRRSQLRSFAEVSEAPACPSRLPYITIVCWISACASLGRAL